MNSERTFFTEKGAAPAQIYAVATLYENLTNEGIDVERIELTTDGGVDLEYSPSDSEGLDPMEAHYLVSEEIGWITGNYTTCHEYADLGDLNVLARTPDALVSWFVDSDWAGKYESGEWGNDRIFKCIEKTIAEVN